MWWHVQVTGSTKLNRKQDLNVLYQVCVFRADRKNKMTALASDWLRHFRLLFWNRCERNSTKLERTQDINVLYQVCVFRADRKNKMAALASDWLSHIWLLLWNRLMEFHETWQEARSQRHLQSCCFAGWSEKQDGRLGLWLAETFSTSSETTEQSSMKLNRKQGLNVLYQVCVFRADRKNKMAAWPLIGWDIFDFSSETAERNSDETWQGARSLRPLHTCSLCFSGRWVNKNGRPGRSVKKVAHFTQVHDMWSFGPLVICIMLHKCLLVPQCKFHNV